MANFANYASGAIWCSNLQLMQVVPSGSQICNYCKWRHLVAKFETNVSGAMLLPSLIQITKSISGSVVPLAMFCHLLKYLSKMDLSALLTPTHSDYHRLRRPLHGSIHCSCVAVVYPTLELICDFRPSKFSNYPSRPVPLPEVFVTTRPDPVPK